MKDLIILVYASNKCYTTVRSTEQNLVDGLEIDLDTCSWKFDGRRYQIGEMRRCEYGCQWGVIGIYDRQDIQHLDAMVRHSNEALRPPVSFYDAEYA